MSLLLRVLGWLGLPSWVAPLVILAAITAAISGAYVKGRLDSSANCREGQLKAQIAAMERDKKVADWATSRALERIKQLEQSSQQDDMEIARYEEELRNRPDKCELTDDDIRMLNNGKHKASGR